MSLNKKHIHHLKTLGHSLKPTVLLGSQGLTEAVLSEIDLALTSHELIKIKIPSENRELKQQIIEAIIRETQAIKVQAIGHILTLYKRNPENQKISFP